VRAGAGNRLRYSTIIRSPLHAIVLPDSELAAAGLEGVLDAAMFSPSKGGTLSTVRGLEAESGKRYPAIGQAWRNAWEHVIPFFAFAPGIRKMIYTTNAVEALHRSLMARYSSLSAASSLGKLPRVLMIL